MIEFAQYLIKDCIGNILEIGNSAFNHFYPEDKILERLNDKNYWIILAQENDLPIGFQMSYEDGGDTYFWLFGVHPSHQKRGIGSKLIDLQEEISKKEGHSKVMIKSHKGHPEAISLYLKKGYIIVGEEPNHWGDSRDAIFFEKTLK